MFSFGQQKYYEEQINAFLKIWKSICEIKKQFSFYIVFYDVCLSGEYDEAYKKNREKFPYKSIDNFLNDLEKHENFEELRLFIEGKIWLLYSVLKSFLGRIVWLAIKGSSENKINDWRQDHALKEILKQALNETQISQIYKQKLSAIKTIIGILETEILQEINFIMSGKKISEDIVSYAKQLALLQEKIKK